MTVASFLEKFDLVADLPNAVATMRHLVLNLAIQGKLVPQDANEEPATELLKRLSLSRERVRQRGGTFPRSSAPQVDLKLPGGWAWARFSDVATIASNLVSPKEFGDFPHLAPDNIEKRTGVLLPCSTVREDKVISANHRFFSGQLVYSKIRPNLAKVVVVDFDGLCSADMYPINPLINAGFLHRFMLSEMFLKQATKSETRVAMPKINQAKLNAIAVPVPPLAEQKRIVAKVDELMALCDRLEAQQKERETRHAALARASVSRFADAPTPANLRFIFNRSYDIPPAQLRASILDLAVRGTLVTQDPNADGADKLLAFIRKDVADAVRAKRMRTVKAIEPYAGEFPFELPASWRWAPLGTLTAPEDGAMCDGPFGSKLKTEHYIESEGYKVLRLGNIGPGYFIHGKEGHISRGHFESLSGNHVAPGDLLVAGLAEPLVRCCEVPPNLGPAVNKADCFRVRLSRHMDRSYVRHYLNSAVAKAFAAEENHGITRERINLASAKALPVPVPPLSEQRRIVAKVDQLMGLVDELEAQLVVFRTAAAKLLDAVVAELTA